LYPESIPNSDRQTFNCFIFNNLPKNYHLGTPFKGYGNQQGRSKGTICEYFTQIGINSNLFVQIYLFFRILREIITQC
jgi:hypothetical protein